YVLNSGRIRRRSCSLLGTSLPRNRTTGWGDSVDSALREVREDHRCQALLRRDNTAVCFHSEAWKYWASFK
ncbi:hypothetical protein, partial [Pseudomonas veronii]|uniref:hypothetical protein n=1 Tax=Pseudomonas veronii TaxID=76761 RepID=UPI001C4346EC